MRNKMAHKSFQSRSNSKNKAWIALAWPAAMLFLLMAACATTGGATPTPGWTAWHWQPAPSPQPISIVRFLNPTSTPDPFATPTPEPSATPTITPTPLPSGQTVPGTISAVDLQASPTPTQGLRIGAAMILQQLFSTTSQFTSVPDERGIAYIKWWGQNTLLTVCTLIDMQSSGAGALPPEMTFIVYNPDNMQIILTAQDVPGPVPEIVCGFVGKQQLSDPPPFSPFDVNQDGRIGIGYLLNGEIVPLMLADAEWVLRPQSATETPEARQKSDGIMGPNCLTCH